MTSSKNSNPLHYSKTIINPNQESKTARGINSSPIKNYTNISTQSSSPNTTIRTRYEFQDCLDGSLGGIERH